MPEQLTKHPEVTLQVLRSAGARCGEGEPQQILTRCPPSRFCQLPGGEVCVYGLAESRQMTQVSAAEWQALQPLADKPPQEGSGWAEVAMPVAASLAIGIAVGAVWMRHGVRKRS